MNPTKQIPKNVKLFVWRQLFFCKSTILVHVLKQDIGGALMVGMM